MSKKISQLDELTTVLDADILPVVNSGATKKVTKQNLLKEIVAALGGKADASHIHDDRYYTQDEINSIIGAIATEVNWGDIGGDLSNQGDLQIALDSKFTLPAFNANSVLFSNGITIVEDSADFSYSPSTNTLFARNSQTDFLGIGTSPVSTGVTPNILTIAKTVASGDTSVILYGINANLINNKTSAQLRGAYILGTNNAASGAVVGIDGEVKNTHATGSTLRALNFQVTQNTASATVTAADGLFINLFQNAVGASIGTLTGATFQANNTRGTVTELKLLNPKVVGSANGITTTVKGIAFDGWTTLNSITNNYAIYADTSIDKGVNRWFIYSLSTSPSLLTGDLEISSSAKGLILKSPNNSRWRVTVNDAGSLVTTSI